MACFLRARRGVGSVLDPMLGRFRTMCRSYRIPGNFYTSVRTETLAGGLKDVAAFPWKVAPLT
jgi:hypothetical protein